jgi:uncharacterized damage-inducible protein DinB
MNAENMRNNLVDFLSKELAHLGVKDAINNIRPGLRNIQPKEEIHSIWEEFGHIRITQEDILRYTLDPSWKSPKWPDEYWPENKNYTDELWDDSISKFDSDLKELISLVKNPEIDLTVEIPHGEGRTYLRQIILVIDHNAYHCGQIVMIRKLLNDWK